MYGFFLSLQVPKAEKMPSEFALIVNTTVSSAGRLFPAGNWKEPKHYIEVRNKYLLIWQLLLKKKKRKKA